MGMMGNSQPVNSGPVPGNLDGTGPQADRPATQLEALCDCVGALEVTARTVLSRTEESAERVESSKASIPCAQEGLATVRVCLERIADLLQNI